MSKQNELREKLIAIFAPYVKHVKEVEPYDLRYINWAGNAPYLDELEALLDEVELIARMDELDKLRRNENIPDRLLQGIHKRKLKLSARLKTVRAAQVKDSIKRLKESSNG